MFTCFFCKVLTVAKDEGKTPDLDLEQQGCLEHLPVEVGLLAPVLRPSFSLSCFA